MAAEHLIEIVVGDPSGDGHGQTYTHRIVSNLPPAAVKAAYDKTVREVGVDLTQVCNEWEDNVMPEDAARRLYEAGCYPHPFEREPYAHPDDYIWSPHDFVTTILFFIHRGNPEFHYREYVGPVFSRPFESCDFGYGTFVS
jgi:hypothetical protein